MALVVDISSLNGALRKGANVLKAIFRDNSQLHEFQNNGTSLDNVYVHRVYFILAPFKKLKQKSIIRSLHFQKFEWPLARNIEAGETLVVQLLQRNIALKQYGMLQVDLKDVLASGYVAIEESLKDERYNETSVSIKLRVYYSSPDGTVGAQWKHENSPFLDDPDLHLQQAEQILNNLQRNISQPGVSGSSVSLLSCDGSSDSPPSGRKLTSKMKRMPMIGSLFSLRRNSTRSEERGSAADQAEVVALLNADSEPKTPTPPNSGFQSLNEKLSLELDQLLNSDMTPTSHQISMEISDDLKSSVQTSTTVSMIMPPKAKCVKMEDFQVCITVIEARQLAGLNMDPCICIQVGDQKKYTSTKDQTNCPYYNEYFVFDFHYPCEMFYDQMIVLSVFQSKRLLRNNPIIGTFKMDVGTVYSQPDHYFFHKWAVLTNPEENNGGPKGYVKCNIAVSSRGKPAKVLPKAEKDEDDIEANLLLPVGISADRAQAKYTLKVYRALGLPSGDSGVVANVKRALSGEAGSLLDPYVEIFFAGHVARTAVKKRSSAPIWNETIVFNEMFPPLVRRVKIQLRDASFSGNIVATHFLELSQISDEGRRGFLPTFGPCWVNLYGAERVSTMLAENSAELNAGLGEGVAFRGKLLLSFKVDLYESSCSSVLRPEISIEPCLPIAESSLGRREEFLLYCCLMDVSMLDKKLSDKPLHIELTMGASGASRDIVEASISQDSDESGDEDETGTHEQSRDSPKPCARSSTFPVRPVSKDQFYNYLPFDEHKPCLYIRDTWPDQRRRLYNTNALMWLSTKLKRSLEDVQWLQKSESPGAERQLKLSLDHFISNSSTYLTVLRSVSCQSGGQTKLDKERLRMCQREIDQIASLARHLKSSAAPNAEKLRQAFEFADRIERLSEEPQHSLPDVFIWLCSGSKRLAYVRFAARDLIFAPQDIQRGSFCSQVQSVFLKLPGQKASGAEVSQIYGQMTLYFWLGIYKQKTGFLNGLPNGYEITRELVEAEDTCGIPPAIITYAEKHHYDLRCHMYQARSLIGSDETGLSDPFARVVFEGHSATTPVVEQTLNPIWDVVLTFLHVEIWGLSSDVQSSPPRVVIQIFDQDPAGKSEHIGQCVAHCVVKLCQQPHEKPKFPPKLQWFPVYCGTERAGEILASFELLELEPTGTFDNFLSLPSCSRISDIGPLVPVPDYIRPSLIKYRIEVLSWGLRDLKRINLSAADKPRVDVECAGQVLQSSVIFNYAKNPNFSTLLQHFDVELPENPHYWPPITIRCVDCRNFGRFVLIGSHTISAIDKFMLRSVEPRHTKKGESKGAAAANATDQAKQNIIIHIDGEPALVSADGTIASDTLTRKLTQGSRAQSCNRKIPSEEDAFDWWSKYFASVDRMITERKSANASPMKETVEKKQNKMVAVMDVLRFTRAAAAALNEHKQQNKAQQRASTSEKPAEMVVYQCELELVPEFEGFRDCFSTFDLLRGKHRHNELSDQSRIVGQFKGGLKICRFPLPPDNQKRLFKHLPSNDPMTVLVRVYIIKANDLHPADINGKADPYVVVNLGRTKINDKQNYISKQLNPVFGKCFEVEAVFPFEHLLTVQVYDWDLIGMDDLIGETKIDIENRFYSRHRATCGLAAKYETTGYNMWRDPMRPSQILSKMCKESQLDGPFYMPGQVRVGGKCFLLPKVPDESTSSYRLDIEPMALYVLRHWADVPDRGYHLVPEHVEIRPLYHPEKPGIEQGRLEMWVDMFPMDMPAPPPPVDISPRKPESYELRVIIWNTDDVILEDDSLVTGEKMSDIYVKGWVKGAEDCQSTDVHYRSVTGEGNFNWRFVFPFNYLKAEEKIVISRKETMFSWDETEFKIPARLELQVWDADSFSADDFLGSLTLDLNRFPRGAKRSKNCSLDIFDPNNEIPMISIFKQKRVKGWWPFMAKNSEGQLELTGKVEVEICLVTAEEAEKNPVGMGRNEPEPLDKPNRPDTSFVWFLSPLKSLRYVLWRNYKWLIIKLIFLVLFLLMVALFLYSVPGYIVKKMLNA